MVTARWWRRCGAGSARYRPLLVAVIAWIAGMPPCAVSLLPSVLVWKFNVSMVITTQKLNYVANYIRKLF